MQNSDRLVIVKESTLNQIEDHLMRIHELLSEPEEIEDLMPHIQRF
jgi:hypothetical protein